MLFSKMHYKILAFFYDVTYSYYSNSKTSVVDRDPDTDIDRDPAFQVDLDPDPGF
jgi:hypothetical protein